MNINSIGQRIRYARKINNLTISKLRELTNLSTGNISDLENEKTLPSSNALIKLAEALGVSIDWILTGKDFNNSNDSIKEILSDKDLELLKNYNLLSKDKQRDIEGFINVSLNSRQND